MKVLKPILILIVVAVIAYIFVPPNLRDGWLYYGYGRILEVIGSQSKALDAYKTSADAMPENILFARTYVRTLNDIAEASDSQSFFQTAETYAEDWIDDYSGSMELWQMYIELARAEWGQGTKSSAKFSIDQAVDLMPTDYVALVYQGIIYRDMRPDNRESVFLSVPIFEQAIRARRHTRTYWAHFELAKAYWLMGEEDSALNELNQAISQYPPRWLRVEAERLKHEIQSSGRSER